MNYKNISKNANWGDIGKINGMLFWVLDNIMNDIKYYARQHYDEIASLSVHCAYGLSGHAKDSQHYKGNAVDFHIEGISAKESYNVIMATLKRLQIENHVGLGVYPEWLNPGFHIDTRGEKARWSQVNGQYVGIEKGLELLR